MELLDSGIGAHTGGEIYQSSESLRAIIQKRHSDTISKGEKILQVYSNEFDIRRDDSDLSKLYKNFIFNIFPPDTVDYDKIIGLFELYSSQEKIKEYLGTIPLDNRGHAIIYFNLVASKKHDIEERSQYILDELIAFRNRLENIS